MQNVNGLWLPSDKPDYKPTVGAKGIKGGYFWPEWYKRCLEYIPSRRVAIDVGAHVGGVTKYLAKHFALVYAYEPWPDHIACFLKNVVGDNVTLRPVAVGDYVGKVFMETGPHTPVRISIGKGFETDIVTLDSENIKEVDFIKINLEGYDLMALKGAQSIIERDRPAIFVEQHHIYTAEYYGLGRLDALPFLEKLGYKFMWQQGPHYFMVHKEQ